MKPTRKTGNPLSPHRQTNWDWRAATNFICGGAGGGLLFCTAVASSQAVDVRPLLLAGLALVGIGLTCVWFEIGRPWRAMNVFLHMKTSWMTREAMVAAVLFAVGAGALFTRGLPLVWLAGLLGLGFVYSQSRILAANKGIPAWRHPGCRPLVVATGLTEGAALLTIAATLMPALASAGLLLAGLATLRLVLWASYKSRLSRDGAPSGSLKALGELDPLFLWGGNALAAALGLFGALAALPAVSAMGGALALLAGIRFKYVLVCRAAFTQGLAMSHLPMRGLGGPKPGAPGVKPGWQVNA